MSHALKNTIENFDVENSEVENFHQGLIKLIDALAREAARRDYASLPIDPSHETGAAQ
jgi:hypothetical protein